MSNLNNLAAALDELGQNWKAFQTRYNDRVEALELKLNRPGNPGVISDTFETPEQAKYREAFTKFIRNPRDQRALGELQELNAKAVTVGTPGSGGYAVPEIISRVVNERLLRLSPVRSVARIETASSSDFKLLVDTNGTGYGWVGEGDSRTETDTPDLEEVSPPSGLVYSYPKASEESMLDIFFNVQSWLQKSVSKHHALAEGIAFISGNGTKKPKGFLDYSKVSTADDAGSPYRAFNAIQYVPTGAAAGFVNDRLGSPAGNPADALLDLLYTLPAEYRALPGTAWMMNSRTAKVIRKFKDGDGNYIWQPSLILGQPDRLLGYPVVEADAMPDLGSNTYPVAFANWPSAYVIIDFPGSMRLNVDEITTPGQVKFYIRKRVGGAMLDNYAIRLLKCATS